MHKILLALALGLAIEGAAQACECTLLHGDRQKREWAREILKTAIAVVEVERIADMDVKAMRGERYRVTRLYSGKAPSTFHVERHFRRTWWGRVDWEPESSCDDFPGAGVHRVVILYDPRPYSTGMGGAAIRKRAAVSPPSTYTFSGMCEQLFMEQAGGLRLLREEAQKLGLTAS